MNHNFYDKNKILKPWGEEHVIFRDKNNLCITLLKIKKNFSTSLHSHPIKKTGFILLEGTADIQLGLYKSNIQKFRSPSKLMIRSGLFHSIKSKTSPYLIALEFETPVKKNDLVRFDDRYGREFKAYEGSKNSVKLNNKDIIIKKPCKNNLKIFKSDKVTASIIRLKSLNKINKFSKNDIFAVISGKLCDKFNRNILAQGDIIKTGTIIKLSEKFKVKKELIFLRVSRI
jgi:mannose-6-phosphate isomerase-like protein (cupin superfamily)